MTMAKSLCNNDSAYLIGGTRSDSRQHPYRYTRRNLLSLAALGAASAALIALGGCSSSRTSTAPDMNDASDTETGTGVERSRDDSTAASAAQEGKTVVAPGETVTLHDEPDSHTYAWTGDLKLTVTGAKMLDGQEALDYAAGTGKEIPDSIGSKDPLSLHKEGRLALISVEATALDGFAIDENMFSGMTSAGLLPSMFNLSSTDERFSEWKVGVVWSMTATYADGTSAMIAIDNPSHSRREIVLETGKTAKVEYSSWVIDGVPAESLVIRPAINAADICTLELGLS